MQVYEKASGDSEFAKELMFNGVVPACEKAGIKLNRTEIKIIGDALREIRVYFLEKLYLAAQPQNVQGNFSCGLCWSRKLEEIK